MTTDFYFADHTTADHEDPRNDEDAAGEGCALCADPMWNLGIK
jgi:hypothetical protein